jgi:hypothetical protein
MKFFINALSKRCPWTLLHQLVLVGWFSNHLADIISLHLHVPILILLHCTEVCDRQHAVLLRHKATYGWRLPPVLVVSVSAQSSTSVQLNEELIIVAARAIDIDTVWVVGVACMQKSSCKQQLHCVILQHVWAQLPSSGRRLKVLLAAGPTQGNIVCVCVFVCVCVYIYIYNYR